MPKRDRLMLALVLLPALLLACGLGRRMPSAETRVPVSQEAADQLAQKLREGINRDEGTFGLEVTDAELTSYVVLKLSEQANRKSDVPLEGFQAQFSGGQMIFSGRIASICPLQLDVRVAAVAQVEDGRLDVTVDKAQLGVFLLPEWLLNSLSRIVTETIVEAPERMEEAVEITDVEVGEGMMRISGRITSAVK
jgi:hypothetical protein